MSEDAEAQVLSLLSKANYATSSSSPSIVIHSSQEMGYTGAAVFDVTVDMSRLFIKHVVLKPGPKLVRDKKSYVCDAYCLANLRDVNVPKLHASYAQGDVVISIMASLNDTHSTSPPTGMEYGEVLKDLITTLAKLHAGRGKGLDPNTDKLWSIGGHVYNPSTYALSTISSSFGAFCAAFAGTSDTLSKALEGGYPDKLQAAAPEVIEELKTRTPHFVHGDAKLANFLFESEGYSGPSSVAVLDFQWSGWGVGASDLVYLLSTCLTEELLPRVEELKTAYFAAVSALDSEYTRARFDRDWHLALLDYVRWVFSYRYGLTNPQTPEMFEERRRRDDPNTGRFQKSVKVVEWLVEGAMAELDLR